MTQALQIKDLSKTYGDNLAVDKVSFSVQEGEFFGLLGPNGAGKTTTISMVTNIVEPTAGTAAVFGHDIRTETRQAKRLCGVVPQDLALYPSLSARANVGFFGSIYGLSGSLLKQRVNEALDIVGLTEHADKPVGSFSGGMKRRANLAAGLVSRPKLLFLDEPTVGVDPQSRNHIFESIQKLNKEGMTIVYTSHYMEEVQELCHRVAIIDHGRLVALDTVEDLIASLGGGVLMIGAEHQPAELLRTLDGLDDVAQITSSDGLLKIETKHAQTALPEVVAAFNRAGVDISSLRILEPNLEAVFLNITGRELRD